MNHVMIMAVTLKCFAPWSALPMRHIHLDAHGEEFTADDLKRFGTTLPVLGSELPEGANGRIGMKIIFNYFNVYFFKPCCRCQLGFWMLLYLVAACLTFVSLQLSSVSEEESREHGDCSSFVRHFHDRKCQAACALFPVVLGCSCMAKDNHGGRHACHTCFAWVAQGLVHFRLFD